MNKDIEQLNEAVKTKYIDGYASGMEDGEIKGELRLREILFKKKHRDKAEIIASILKDCKVISKIDELTKKEYTVLVLLKCGFYLKTGEKLEANISDGLLTFKVSHENTHML